MTSPGMRRSLLHGREARLLGVEDPRRAAVEQPLVAGELHDAALRREVPAQDREPARGLERRLDRDDDLLALPLDRLPRRSRRACARRRSAPRRGRAPPSRARARRARRRPPRACRWRRSGRRASGSRRPASARRSRSKSSSSKGMSSSRAIASRWRTPFVEPPVAAIAAVGVLERLARDDLGGADALPHEVHREPARPARPPRSSSGRAPGSR